jgi:hypothetical protein
MIYVQSYFSKLIPGRKTFEKVLYILPQTKSLVADTKSQTGTGVGFILQFFYFVKNAYIRIQLRSAKLVQETAT